MSKRRHYIAKNGDSTFFCGLLRPNTQTEARKFGKACFKGDEDQVTCPKCKDKLEKRLTKEDVFIPIAKADPYEEGRESLRKEIVDRFESFLPLLEAENCHSDARTIRGWVEDLKANKKLRSPL